MRNGAIFFTSRYGSTAQYAEWISEETGLPVFNVRKAKADPAAFDFLVLGCPVIYHRLPIARWVRKNLTVLDSRPILFLTVAGAPAGPKLDGWIARSLPEKLIARMTHFALRGRQNPAKLTRFDRMMLIIGGLANPDRQAAREELHGFDFMDRASIGPVVKRIRELQSENI